MEWKWTKGEPYERSRRLKHVQELENKEFSQKMETNAYSSSLNYDENTWNILNQSIQQNEFTATLPLVKSISLIILFILLLSIILFKSILLLLNIKVIYTYT